MIRRVAAHVLSYWDRRILIAQVQRDWDCYELAVWWAGRWG